MRFQPLAQLALAALVVGAPVALQDQLPALEQALHQTVRAIEVLGGLRQGPPRTDLVETARSVTEAPSGDALARDARLQALRRDVGRLQARYDELAGATPPVAGATGDASGGAEPIVPPPEVTTGLDARTRAALLGSGEVRPERAPRRPAATASGSTAAGAAPLAPSDPLRQARACFRAGLYDDALRLLATVEATPEKDYWMGRALERLQRVDEAIDAYRRAADSEGGWIAERARHDLEFLEWRRAFMARISQREAGQNGGPR